MFAVVDDLSKLFWCTSGEEIDGVRHRRAGEQLCLQFICHRAFYLRNIQSTLGQGICEHDTRAASMGDDGEILALQRWQGEDTTHGGEFLT